MGVNKQATVPKKDKNFFIKTFNIVPLELISTNCAALSWRVRADHKNGKIIISCYN